MKFLHATFSRVWVSKSENFTKRHAKNGAEDGKLFHAKFTLLGRGAEEGSMCEALAPLQKKTHAHPRAADHALRAGCAPVRLARGSEGRLAMAILNCKARMASACYNVQVQKAKVITLLQQVRLLGLPDLEIKELGPWRKEDFS